MACCLGSYGPADRSSALAFLRGRILIMPLPVVSFSTYLTSTEGVMWRADDYNARDFILAIKDRDVAGYAFVRRGRIWKRFENANRQDVVVWFGEMVVEYCERHPPASQFVLVPVPGSKVDLGFRGLHRTTRLANEIASVLPSGPTVRDILRWESPIPPSRSANGTRDVAFLYDRLRSTGSAAGERVVLVDDVLALGGHVRACAAKLRAGGAEPILALCAGRADQIQVPDPFAIRCETLNDFEPGVERKSVESPSWPMRRE
jgi:predicted amidophosphoribosyltransferase